jgi:hypothetical protein
MQKIIIAFNPYPSIETMCKALLIGWSWRKIVAFQAAPLTLASGKTAA